MYHVLYKTYFYKFCSTDLWQKIKKYFVVSGLNKYKKTEVFYLLNILKKYVLKDTTFPFYVSKYRAKVNQKK